MTHFAWCSFFALSTWLWWEWNDQTACILLKVIPTGHYCKICRIMIVQRRPHCASTIFMRKEPCLTNCFRKCELAVYLKEKQNQVNSVSKFTEHKPPEHLSKIASCFWRPLQSSGKNADMTHEKRQKLLQRVVRITIMFWGWVYNRPVHNSQKGTIYFLSLHNGSQGK